MYLFIYYLGSSIAGATGGLFYTRHGWTGVAGFTAALFAFGLAVACRLYFVPPLAQAQAAGSAPPMP
jgi:YNFM family putative membrane transporter